MWGSRTGRRIAVALLLLSLPTVKAAAGTITSINAVILPGNSTGSISLVATPAPNNDNAVGSGPNVILYTIDFNSGGVGSLDVEFNIANSGGTTEYWFTQSLVNNTSSLWTGFHYELGFGTGASFIRSTSADLLDLDAPDGDPVPTSGNFSVFDLETDTLEWSGGSVPFVSSLSQAFSIDVPDNLSTLNPGGQNRFTLRQRPMTSSASIPEPATLTLLGLGLVGLGLSCRKQQRTRPRRLLRYGGTCFMWQRRHAVGWARTADARSMPHLPLVDISASADYRRTLRSPSLCPRRA